MRYQILENLSVIGIKGNVVFYLDPPYPHKTRLSLHRYPNDLDNQGHERLLKAVLNIDKPILISSYKNDLYDYYLKDWNTIQFNSQTRSGKSAVETVYYNYDTPKQLHDYSFFGNNYKEREQFKLKSQRMVSKFKNMSAVERNFYINALAQNGIVI